MTALQINRPIRSFVRREGRMTQAQARAIDTLWQQYGVDLIDTPLDLDALFGHRAPRILEIGFGNGESLAVLAQRNPDVDFLGIEVHRPGVGHLLMLAHERDIRNLRVICADAVEVLSKQLPQNSLDTIQIFFPDPWPKKRHHKRRLIQAPLVKLLIPILKPGGRLHLATDWQNYAEHMLAVLEAESDLVNTQDDGFAPRPDERPVTKFERRGQKLGHWVWDLIFTRR